MIDAELLHVLREGHIDCVHRGRVVLLNAAETVLYERGQSHGVVFMRSLAKPFQAQAVVASGAADHFGFSPAELALISGSHNGSSEQAQIIAAMLDKIGLPLSALGCGASTPIDRKTAEQLVRDGQKPTALHHPCSGKHTGMLAICRAKGWDTSGYTHADHPVQRYITDLMKTVLALSDDQCLLALDGCSVPTYGVPLYNVALGFARLGVAVRTQENTPAARIASALQANPLLYSGQRRMDSALMMTTHSRLIAKDGTEGILALAVPEKSIGLAIKISDGSSRAIMPVVVQLLRAYGCLSDDEASALRAQFPEDLAIHTGAVASHLHPLTA
ncbi:MAG: asparaginase [Chloroflexi bacterium]|nr:asparaginase [Chloroflexota bacterium]